VTVAPTANRYWRSAAIRTIQKSGCSPAAEQRFCTVREWRLASVEHHAPAFRLAQSLGNYKGRRPHMATALASMALLLFALFFVVWLVTLLRL